MKILFFDSWLKGVKNFTRLMPELRRHTEVECLMVHTASWKGEDSPEITEIDGLRCVDIKHYGTNSLYHMLKRERPDLVLTLNMYNFVDRTLVMLCRRLGISIIYLSHGRFSLSDASDLTALVESRRRKKSLAERFNRENRMMFGNYALATLRVGKPWRFAKAMWQYFTDPAQRSVNTPYCEELTPDKILLYYESDRQVMTQNRHFPDSNIYVVGNPELDSFITSPLISRDELRDKYGLPDQPYLLYLDDGLPQNKLMEIAQWQDHIREINAIAKSQGMVLVIKLHPRTDAEALTEFFASEGIKAYQRDIDFKSLIHHSEAVTSIFSSTIAFALILGKRVISPRWDTTAGFPQSYPADVIKYAPSRDAFAQALSDGAPTCTNPDYIRSNFGDTAAAAIPQIAAHLLNCNRGQVTVAVF